MNRFAFQAEAAAVPLRGYQQQTVDALVGEITSPARTTNKFVVVIATGGGKRLVFAEFIRRHVLSNNLRVLIVTALGWRLLAQQAETLCQRERGGEGLVSYVGGRDAEQEFVGMTQGTAGPIVFSTFQTWAARRDTDFAESTFDVVLIDELHHGEEALIFNALVERYLENAIFVGCTGTPRNWTDFKPIGNHGFASLVEKGFLARPVIHPPVSTGVLWSPQRSSSHGDVTMRSLAELGAHDGRNRVIVSTYLKDKKKFGKTLVFCCDIAHAEALNAMFTVAGVKSGVVHCKQKYDARLQTQAAFEKGQLDILTNVMTMTTGVDLPDLQTIFLARPTLSEVLFSQMIGRGSRLTKTKTEFTIVDFVDNVQTHGLDLIRPDGFLGTGRPLRCPLITRHDFAPAALEVIQGASGYEVLEGLELEPSQTFGVEFEASGQSRDGTIEVEFSTRLAQRILDALRAAGLPTARKPCGARSRGGQNRAKDNSVWNIEPDASCGWEVTSRILRGRDGFAEIVDACRVLETEFQGIGLRVDHRKVGTHVHLGWGKELQALKQLMVLGAFYEPALMSLVAPSRVRNPYVYSVRNRARKLMSLSTMADWEEHFAGHHRKYLAINPSHLFEGYGSVEIRHHSGTIEASKILAWISLWMRVLATARQKDALPGSPYARPRTLPLCRGERGDVALMCDRLGVGSALRARLLARRDQVVSRWWAQDPRFTQLAVRMLQEWDGYDVPIASVSGAQAAE
jgi:superfamily II DNA or RNA helicase